MVTHLKPPGIAYDWTPFRTVTLRNDRGFSFTSSIELVAVMCRNLKRVLRQTHCNECDDAICVIMADCSAEVLACLRDLLHAGCLTIRGRSVEECKSFCLEVQKEFRRLGVRVPKDFWTPLFPQDTPHEAKEDAAVVPMLPDFFGAHAQLPLEDNDEFIKVEPKVEIREEECFGSLELKPKKCGKKHTVKRFPCDFCGKSLHGRAGVQRHVKDVHPEVFSEFMAAKKTAEYKCDTCHRMFTSPGRLDRHFNNSNCRHEVMCDICGNSFSSPNSMLQHKRLSHVNEAVVCSQCGKVLKNKQVLALHINRYHNHKRHCDICNKDFSSQFELRDHILSLHTDNDKKPFKCDICGKGFGRKKCYEEHYTVHMNIKPFMCDLCGKGFGRKKCYDIHKMIHLNLKPHKCRICDYASASIANRNKHERLTHKYNHKAAMAATEVTQRA